MTKAIYEKPMARNTPSGKKLKSFPPEQGTQLSPLPVNIMLDFLCAVYLWGKKNTHWESKFSEISLRRKPSFTSFSPLISKLFDHKNFYFVL